jgi:phosphoribosylaminoimidazole-succinocarboxamide synthase
LATKKVLFDNGSKRLIEYNSEDQLVQSFSDYVTSTDGSKKSKVKNKGTINNAVSAHLFEYLESYHVMTHFISKLNEREMIIKNIRLFPLDVVLTNIASGEFCKRAGLKEGKVLEAPVLEYFYRNADMKNSILSTSQILEQNILSADELNTISRMSFKINALMRAFLKRRQINLVDCKLRFGKHKNHIILADELTPDTCRLWDLETNEKLDKDRFLLSLGELDQKYQEVYDRIFMES